MSACATRPSSTGSKEPACEGDPGAEPGDSGGCTGAGLDRTLAGAAGAAESLSFSLALLLAALGQRPPPLEAAPAWGACSAARWPGPPVPPSGASQPSSAWSSQSGSGPTRSWSGTPSASVQGASTRRTSRSESSLRIFLAVSTSDRLRPRRPPTRRRCGSMAAAKHSRTFFTLSTASRIRGFRNRLVKTYNGSSRMTESHMRM
mmetsp:Transcript_282/g.857  ORF Transcript_282/g.857 Transcript_282/m.857 type:complete len:204 (-) Transcript_282:318-929(-)